MQSLESGHGAISKLAEYTALSKDNQHLLRGLMRIKLNNLCKDASIVLKYTFPLKHIFLLLHPGMNYEGS